MVFLEIDEGGNGNMSWYAPTYSFLFLNKTVKEVLKILGKSQKVKFSGTTDRYLPYIKKLTEVWKFVAFKILAMLSWFTFLYIMPYRQYYVNTYWFKRTQFTFLQWFFDQMVHGWWLSWVFYFGSLLAIMAFILVWSMQYIKDKLIYEGVEVRPHGKHVVVNWYSNSMVEATKFKEFLGKNKIRFDDCDC